MERKEDRDFSKEIWIFPLYLSRVYALSGLLFDERNWCETDFWFFDGGHLPSVLSTAVFVYGKKKIHLLVGSSDVDCLSI